jgi:Family of unknown function (DUF6184)
MKSAMSMVLSAVATVGMAIFAACGDDQTDNTIFEPSREARIDDFAETACERYEDCAGYGTGSGQAYQSETDCEIDLRQRAVGLWPVDRCAGGRINDTRFDACVASVRGAACGAGLIDSIAALGDCNADIVCTDPPR